MKNKYVNCFIFLTHNIPRVSSVQKGIVEWMVTEEHVFTGYQLKIIGA